jgi:predicted permease
MHLRQALRRLVRFPVFTTIAVFTLALGIGANSAVFAVVYGVLLKPLSYPAAERLVAVDHAAPGVNLASAGAAPFLYFTYREQSKTLESLGIWTGDTASVTGLAEPEEIPVVDVTEGVLPTLGVQPVLGRLFSKADDSPGAAETVVLSHAYWQARFGSSPDAIGRRVMFDGKPREVIGVLPASFRFLDRDASAFIPLQLDRSKTFLGNFSYRAVARMKNGETVERVNAELAQLIPVAIGSFPPFPGFNPKMFAEAKLAPAVRFLKADLIGDVGKVLWVLMGTIGMVLLIACANVANLLLVRTDGRQQELAIRSALGAGRARIARELLVESLALGLAGGLAGLGLAYAGLKVLLAVAPATLPRLSEIGVNGPVLAFSVVLSLLAGALFGGILVLKYAAPRVASALRAGGRSMSASRERQRARNVLVVAQIALAMVLLVSSGLMIRTFVALRHVDPGFTNPASLLTLRVTIPSARVKDPEQVLRMQQNIADKIAAIAGVQSVALTSIVPMTEDGWHDPIFAEDKTYSEGQIPPLRLFKFVTPGLLQTMGNKLVAGRDFTWDDLYGRHPVALVSENLAREMWAQPSAALGKRIRENTKGQYREIVGVVADERDDGVDAAAPATAYWPMLMANFSGDEVFIRRAPAFVIRSTRAASSAFVREVSAAIWSVNPELPLASVRTMKEVYDKSMGRTSFALVMLSIAGGMALLLGVAGIYGVISFGVAQRQREIGIRVALGARPSQVTGMFLRQGLILASVGALIGLAGAMALMRLMASLLFGVNAIDPLTYGGVVVGLVGAALLASYMPAARAAGLNPVEALRGE